MTRKIEFAPELIAEGKRPTKETDVPIHAIAARMESRGRLCTNASPSGNGRRAAIAAANSPKRRRLPSRTRVCLCQVRSARQCRSPNGYRASSRARWPRSSARSNVLGPANSAEAERTARMLATIARTVQEIKATARDG